MSEELEDEEEELELLFDPVKSEEYREQIDFSLVTLGHGLKIWIGFGYETAALPVYGVFALYDMAGSVRVFALYDRAGSVWVFVLYNRAGSVRVFDTAIIAGLSSIVILTGFSSFPATYK